LFGSLFFYPSCRPEPNRRKHCWNSQGSNWSRHRRRGSHGSEQSDGGKANNDYRLSRQFSVPLLPHGHFLARCKVVIDPLQNLREFSFPLLTYFLHYLKIQVG